MKHISLASGEMFLCGLQALVARIDTYVTDTEKGSARCTMTFVAIKDQARYRDFSFFFPPPAAFFHSVFAYGGAPYHFLAALLISECQIERRQLARVSAIDRSQSTAKRLIKIKYCNRE